MLSTRSGLIQNEIDNPIETDPSSSKKELFGKIGPSHLRAWHFHRLSGNDRAVDVALGAHNLRGDGVVWPSLEAISEMTGIPHATHIVRSIGRLEKVGRLKRKRVRSAKGRWDRTEYTLIPWRAASDQTASDQVRSVVATSDQHTPSTTDQFRSQPPTRSGHLNREYEEITGRDRQEGERVAHAHEDKLRTPDLDELPNDFDGPDHDALAEFVSIWGPNPANPADDEDDRATCIPEDWWPDQETGDFAKNCHPDIDVEEETEKFRDYYLGTGKKRKDWNRAFRSWCWKYDKFEFR